MVYDGVLSGRFVDLRSITEEDAEFSFWIRSRPEVASIVGQPAATVQEQREYIKRQLELPGDYYFVVLNKAGEKIGMIGVYNIADGIGETGREVSIGSSVEAMEAEIVLYDFCIDVLHLEKLSYIIYAENRHQLSIQKKNGILPIKQFERNGHLCLYFEFNLSREATDKKRNLLNRL